MINHICCLQRIKSKMMKKNLLGALVIFFVTFACLLVINEVATNNTSEIEDDRYYVVD